MALKICGPIGFREGCVAVNEVVLGHRHYFPHATQALDEPLEVCELEVHKLDVFDRPLEAAVAVIKDKAHPNDPDEIDPTLIGVIEKRVVLQRFEKHDIAPGKYHTIRSVSGAPALYQCLYPHRALQTISVVPGEFPLYQPLMKRDEDGKLWLLMEEDVILEGNDWEPAYQ